MQTNVTAQSVVKNATNFFNRKHAIWSVGQNPKKTCKTNHYLPSIFNISAIEHDANLHRLRHLKITSLIHMRSQRPLVWWLLNMHRRHPAMAIGPRVILNKVSDYLLGNHVRAGATPSPRPTETAFSVAVGYCDCASRAWTLEHMYQEKGVCADGF